MTQMCSCIHFEKWYNVESQETFKFQRKQIPKQENHTRLSSLFPIGQTRDKHWNIMKDTFVQNTISLIKQDKTNSWCKSKNQEYRKGSERCSQQFCLLSNLFFQCQLKRHVIKLLISSTGHGNMTVIDNYSGSVDKTENTLKIILSDFFRKADAWRTKGLKSCINWGVS
jgi:hypothetical protein